MPISSPKLHHCSFYWLFSAFINFTPVSQIIINFSWLLITLGYFLKSNSHFLIAIATYLLIFKFIRIEVFYHQEHLWSFLIEFLVFIIVKFETASYYSNVDMSSVHIIT